MLPNFLILTFVLIQFSEAGNLNSKWHYQCTEGFCEKTLITSNVSNPLSLAECNLLCLNYSGVWPRPTGSISVANLTEIATSKIVLTGAKLSESLLPYLNIFTKQIRSSFASESCQKLKGLKRAEVKINIDIANPDVEQLIFGTNESYVVESDGLKGNVLNVNVKAETYFGARHALETLSQLVVHDDLRRRTLFPIKISISDGPVYQWRGLMLDTSRNYVSVKAIKRTLRAMAASKLNTFHWHLTDSASFPYVSKSRPELSAYGAYSPKSVYNDSDVKKIVEYARVRGIRVVPELDAPAHVGEGWQDTGVLTCFNIKPWTTYCAEPPCGQLDPSRPQLYDILEDIYGDLLEQFGTEVFHMGGDEVNTACWNQTANLTAWMVNEQGWGLNRSDFIGKVWPYFQSEAAKRLYKKAGKEIPVILWTSDLTQLENVTEVLPPSNYIIQVWSASTEASIQVLLEKNYTVILSNFDNLYLDCGFAGWALGGNNWCSPYKGWQQIYDNKPSTVVGNRTSQVLGGETALWTEESGTASVDSRLWPRAAALAETLWAEPSTNWQAAEERMLIHRNRLVALGVGADELQPEWCLQHQQHCPISGRFNK